MGNVCIQSPKLDKDEDEKPQKNRNMVSSPQFQSNSTYVNDEWPRQQIESPKVEGQNTFAKKNEIGPYFCGGSLDEKNAMSYPNRVQEFEVIMKQCSMKDKKYKKQKSKGKGNKDTQIKEDMNNTFNQQFRFLPEMLTAISPKVLSKTIRNGPPIKYRWVSWKGHLLTLTGPDSIEKARIVYQRSLTQDSKEQVQIDKDINRTFPEQTFFTSKSQQSQSSSSSKIDNDSISGYLPLKRVLSAISVVYPDLGYCQGMNFILGFILMINGAKEDEAFWMFKTLAEHKDFMLMGLYEESLPLLRFLEYFAKQILVSEQKELMEYFEFQGVQDSFWLTKWILTLFLYNFPAKICSRFWDYLITSDIFSIVKLLVGLLDVFKARFMEGDACDFMDAFTQVTANEAELMNPASSLYINFSELYKKASTCKFDKKTIARIAETYIKTQDSSNEYAKLYSKYDNSKQFDILHAKLIALKVKEFSSLSLVHEVYDDKLEGSQRGTTNNEEVAQKQVSIGEQAKHEDSIANLTTGIDISQAKNEHHLPGLVRESSDVFGYALKQNQETPLPSQRNSAEKYQIRVEQPQLQLQHHDHSRVEEKDEQYLDECYSNQGSNEDTMLEKSRKQTLFEHHQMAIEFDGESFNLFQSLVVRNIESFQQPSLPSSLSPAGSAQHSSSRQAFDFAGEKEVSPRQLDKSSYVSSSASLVISQIDRQKIQSEMVESNLMDEKEIQNEINAYRYE